MSSTVNAGPVWNVPHARNPLFTGRSRETANLRAALLSSHHSSRLQAITGLGGTGKTQVATEYAYRHRADYAIVWWVSAEEPATLALGFAKLAAPLGLHVPDGTTLEHVRHAVIRALGNRTDWLLVFDNAPAPEAVRNYVPPARMGHVIVTSRSAHFGSLGTVFPLRGLERPDSVALLKKRSGNRGGDAAAATLAHALGDLPLALDQAAACVAEAGIDFAAYLGRFETHWADLLRDGARSPEYPAPVAMTWDLAFGQVAADAPAATDLLRLLAFLGPDPIPKALLRNAAHAMPPSLVDVALDPSRLDGAVASLMRFSLVEDSGKTVGVHRLVGSLTRDRLPPESRRAFAASAAELMEAQFKFDSHDLATWDACGRMLPQALAAAEHAAAADVAPRAVVTLLDDVGRYLHRRADFGGARRVLTRAVEVASAFYGSGHPRVSGITNDLGRALMAAGHPREARDLFQRSLAIDQDAYGQGDPHVASVVNNYALALTASGDHDTARAQFEWALGVYEQHYGPAHPKVATVVNNLGYVLNGRGDAAAARAHFERALGIAEASYGPRHPTVAHIRTNLGSSLRRLGDLAGARVQFEQSLAISEAAHGPAHPAVARASAYLGALLHDLGLLDSACEHFQRALAIDEAVYGPEHRTVGHRLRQLSVVHRQMNDFARADAMAGRAAAIAAVTPPGDDAGPPVGLLD